MSDVDRIAEILRRHRRVLNLDSGTSHCFASRSGQCDFTGGVRADWEAHIAPLIEAALHPRIDTVERLFDSGWDTGTVIQEIPQDDMEFYPQLWEMAFQCGWTRVGSKYDPLDDEPRLPCRVLYMPEDQSDG